MCAYGNSISTTRDHGLYTKPLVCPALGLLVPLFTEKLQSMDLSGREEDDVDFALFFLSSPRRGLFTLHFALPVLAPCLGISILLL